MQATKILGSLGIFKTLDKGACLKTMSKKHYKSF